MPTLYSRYSFQAIGIEQMKAHYHFTEQDAQTLQTLLPVAQASLESMVEAFYNFIFKFEHAQMFLNTDAIKKRHRDGIVHWYLGLFEGIYDEAYFQKLTAISETHVKIGFPSHYVNAAFSFIRQFVERLVVQNNSIDALPSLHKIIDINLDILSLTYRQEAQQKLLSNVMLLKKTIEEQSVIPYVQPIYSNQGNQISHYECLMRLQDKKNHTVCSILSMLQLSKEIMVYNELMHQMMQKVFAIFQKVPHAFTLNIGYEDIANPHFRETLIGHLETLPNPSRVVFKILESDMITDFDELASFIDLIKTFGAQIAIDDFGTGYSNMENILQLKPDYIKIDGSLIHNIDLSEKSHKLVQNIINIAHDIGAKTVSEHVHSKEVYETLQKLDIDYLQGFYLSEPLPLLELLNP